MATTKQVKIAVDATRKMIDDPNLLTPDSKINTQVFKMWLGMATVVTGSLGKTVPWTDFKAMLETAALNAGATPKTAKIYAGRHPKLLEQKGVIEFV
jgi:hypothetical protein